MFNTIKEFIKKVIDKMFNKDTIQKAVNVDIAMNSDMYNNIQNWNNIYIDKAPWVNNKTVFSMNVGAGIASELARLVTIEFESKISNNEFLDKEYQAVIDNIRNYTEYACATGGVCFKPYVSNGHIEVDVVQATNFFPTAYNSRNEITGCILPETITKGDTTYTRIEYHNFVDGAHTVINRAFKQKNLGNYNIATQSLGDEIPLSEVAEWASITPEFTIRNVDRPLFSYFKMPLANTIDPNSPLGMSVFSKISKVNGILNEIDIRYSQIKWEYESKETAIDVGIDMIKPKRDNKGNIIDWGLAAGKERLYRLLNIDVNADKTSSWNIFSPEIRDSSYFNGLNKLLRTAEFLCGMAYGTISDPNETDKTAEEIKASKQRSFQQNKDIQKSLKNALKNLVYAMQIWGQVAKLPVNPVNVDKDVSFDFDDSIIVDKDKEIASMQTDVSLGIIKPVYYVMKKYNKTKKEAEEMLQEQTIVKGDPFAQTQE